jgi:hypothetical protein
MWSLGGVGTVRAMAGTDSEQDASTGRRPRGDRHVFGLLLIGLGTVWFLSESHLLALSAETVLSVLLILLALGLIYTARWGRRMGRFPILLGIGLTVALIANSPSLHFPSVRGGVGDQSPAIASLADLQPVYEQAFGNLTLDLTVLTPADLEHERITVHMGAGDVKVALPQGTPVAFDGRIRAGQLSACGQPVSEGFAPRLQYRSLPPDGPHLELVVRSGAGNVTVTGCEPSPVTTPSPPLPSPPPLPGGKGPA